MQFFDLRINFHYRLHHIQKNLGIFLKQAHSVFLQDQVGTLAQIQNWPLHHPEKNKALFITAVQ